MKLCRPEEHEPIAEKGWEDVRARGEHGRGRCTLWTGDVGVALYLRSCLADPRVPTIDSW